MTDQCTGVVPSDVQEVAYGKRRGLCEVCGGWVGLFRYGTMRPHVNWRQRQALWLGRRVRHYVSDFEASMTRKGEVFKLRLIRKPQLTLAERIVNAVVADIYGRSGGDHWWDGIEEDIMNNEVIPSLVRAVEAELEQAIPSRGES